MIIRNIVGDNYSLNPFNQHHNFIVSLNCYLSHSLIELIESHYSSEINANAFTK